MSNKRKLSKTVLEMKFMKRSKIQQEKHDDENENIEVLTDQRIKGERQSYFVIEKNWEILENLRCSRLNYGMSSKKSDLSSEQNQTEQTENNYDEKPVREPKKKQIRLIHNDTN